MRDRELLREDSGGELAAVVGSMVTAAILGGVIGYTIALLVQGTWGMLIAFLIGSLIMGSVVALGAIHMTKTVVKESKRLRAQNKQMAKVIQRINETEIKKFYSFLQDYYEGTGITTFTFGGEDDLILKVGNEDHIVPVDMNLMKKDTIAALEKAHLDWMDGN